MEQAASAATALPDFCTTPTEDQWNQMADVIIDDDTVTALGGNDIIIASAGHDTVDGGAGTDRIRVIATSPGLFTTAGVESYTATASRLTNGSGTLDTAFTAVERLDITDLRAGNATVSLSGFTGAATIVLGNGNHTITGSRSSGAPAGSCQAG